MKKQALILSSFLFALPAVAQIGNPMYTHRYEEYTVPADSKMFISYLRRVRKHDDEVQFISAALAGMVQRDGDGAITNAEIQQAISIGTRAWQLNDHREGLDGI